MRVLIIGGTGFIGYYTVNELLQKEHLQVKPTKKDTIQGMKKE